MRRSGTSRGYVCAYIEAIFKKTATHIKVTIEVCFISFPVRFFSTYEKLGFLVIVASTSAFFGLVRSLFVVSRWGKRMKESPKKNSPNEGRRPEDYLWPFFLLRDGDRATVGPNKGGFAAGVSNWTHSRLAVRNTLSLVPLLNFHGPLSHFRNCLATTTTTCSTYSS